MTFLRHVVIQNDPMFRQRAFVTDEDIRGIPSFRDQVDFSYPEFFMKCC